MTGRAHRVLVCAIGLMSGCAGPAPGRDSPASAPGASAPSAPLALDVMLWARGWRQRALLGGDTVESGERLRVEVRTSIPAHLYLAYCNEHRELTVFPAEGSVVTRAEELSWLPAADADLILDDNPGAEALYVIASRTALTHADPALSRAIARSRPDRTRPDCGTFRAATRRRVGSKRPDVRRARRRAPAGSGRAESSSVTPQPPPGDSTGPAPPADSTGTAPPADSTGTAPPAETAPPAQPTARLVPPVTIERGAYVEWSGDARIVAGEDTDGIVVLRYDLDHVVPSAPRRVRAR